MAFATDGKIISSDELIDALRPLHPAALRLDEASLAIQRALAAHNERAAEHPVRVRIGMSAGEPVEENEDLFGAAVQLARRACEHASPERIVVPTVIRDLCVGKGYSFDDLGKITLKGFPSPVRLHEVVWS